MERDEELYFLTRNGNLKAFDLLYERYQLCLFRFILSYLNNKEEAEEVFHEAFMKVLNKPSEANFSDGSFKAWIYTVARNLCLNRIRSQRRGQEVLSSFVIESEEDAIENEVIHKDLAQRVLFVAEKLPRPMWNVTSS